MPPLSTFQSLQDAPRVAHGAAPPGPRRGFTLIEVAVSLVIVSIIVSSLGSIIVLTSRALPGAAGANESTLAASLSLDQLRSELRFATKVSEATATAITFTVPDRDSDLLDETIRYSWAGPGSPLLRQYNGKAAAPVAASLNSFAITYTKNKYTTVTSGTTTWDSGEVQLAGFTTFGGLSVSNNLTLSTTTWGSEAFAIDQVTLPADTTRFEITRVSLKLRKSGAGADLTVGIHLPSATGSSIPAASPIATPATIPVASLPTSYGWVDAAITGVVFPDASKQNFVLVCKGTAGTAALLQYLSIATAAIDSNVFRWTTNSGSTWQPTLNLQLQDAPFAVYGKYQRQITANVNTDTYTLGSVSVSLQATTASSTRIDTGIEALNEPSIPGP